MKYIRTEDGIYEIHFDKKSGNYFYNTSMHSYELYRGNKYNIADTIEELIQIGDIVFYWAPSDDKEHCIVINYDTELHSIKYNAITKLLIPVEEDYKCVAKGYPSFNVIKNKRYLVNKGELELL